MTILFWHDHGRALGVMSVMSHCARVLPLTTCDWLSNVVFTLPGPKALVLPVVCRQCGIGFQEEVGEDAAWTKTCTEPTVFWELQIVSDDVVQAVFTPAAQKASAAHAAHGAVPEADQFLPTTHGTSSHTVSDVVVQAVFTPAVQVASAVHASHGALPDPEKVVPATHGASLQVSDVQSQ